MDAVAVVEGWGHRSAAFGREAGVVVVFGGGAQGGGTALQPLGERAGETRRRRWATAPAPDSRLTAVHRTALAEIACGHVVASSSLGREFTRSREPKVLMSTLRALETKGLAERTAGSAHAAYVGGPPLDRVRLTPAGITALASVIDSPPAGPSTAPATTPRPLPATAQATARSR
ncbi:hypothetical protein PBV52_02320 [Streptomyces sp. T12]|uniref:hypothetical protein n=1 Tax=Streptomyces sp. T12 TaxID=477697 RepID=UPI002365D64D|nr:hypothetical protein [Streptomyces sp. T12]WDF35717.1 hypothetical protein PBV52_02320 [Streptomyces sp. T12]